MSSSGAALVQWTRQRCSVSAKAEFGELLLSMKLKEKKRKFVASKVQVRSYAWRKKSVLISCTTR